MSFALSCAFICFAFLTEYSPTELHPHIVSYAVF